MTSSTFLNNKYHSNLKTSPITSSTLIHSSKNSKNSKFKKNSNTTQKHNNYKSHKQKKKSLKLFQTNTKNKLISTNHNKKTTKNPSPITYKKKNQKQNIQYSKTNNKINIIKKQIKKNILKKFLSFNNNTNHSKLYTITYL